MTLGCHRVATDFVTSTRVNLAPGGECVAAVFGSLTMSPKSTAIAAALLLALAGTPAFAQGKPVTLLNVSYDPTRELYQDFNTSFAQYWKTKTGQEVKVQQSHGGSGKQARAVIDGLEADVVTLALAYDVDAVAAAGLLPANWQTLLPDNSAPYTSTIVFLVRKGNPKGIKDWGDLVKPGIGVITPNPKDLGRRPLEPPGGLGLRAQSNGGDEAKARDFVGRFSRTRRSSTPAPAARPSRFVERGLGDVLIAWENEALLADRELGKGKFEIVAPSVSILAEPHGGAGRKGRRQDRAPPRSPSAYLEVPLRRRKARRSPPNTSTGRARPRSAAKHAATFPKVELFTIDQLFGGWTKAQQKHFADGGSSTRSTSPEPSRTGAPGCAPVRGRPGGGDRAREGAEGWRFSGPFLGRFADQHQVLEADGPALFGLVEAGLEGDRRRRLRGGRLRSGAFSRKLGRSCSSKPMPWPRLWT